MAQGQITILVKHKVYVKNSVGGIGGSPAEKVKEKATETKSTKSGVEVFMSALQRKALSTLPQVSYAGAVSIVYNNIKEGVVNNFWQNGSNLTGNVAISESYQQTSNIFKLVREGFTNPVALVGTIFQFNAKISQTNYQAEMTRERSGLNSLTNNSRGTNN